MRALYSFFYPVSFLFILSACDQNGGAMPLEGRDLLSSFAGPTIPTIEDTRIKLAKEAESRNDFAQASQEYQQILENDPDNAAVFLLLGDSLRRNGEYEKAISAYDSLLAKDPNNIGAKEGKALAFLSKADFETPTNLFQEVLKQDAKRWKSLNGLGILFVTRGLYSEAIQYFNQALINSPDNISVMNNLGLSQALNKQYSAAVDTLSAASVKSKLNSYERKRVDLNLALVHASSGNLGEARKLAEIYLSGPALANNLGLYAHLAKDNVLAKSYLNMALTESKTYYGKAWENLETLNNSSPNQGSIKSVVTQPSNKISDGNIISPEIKNDNSKVVTAAPTEVVEAIKEVPPVTSSTVNSLEKSLGTIKLEKPSQDNTVTTPVVK